jgi:undecaprenyl diphosphate synthase
MPGASAYRYLTLFAFSSENWSETGNRGTSALMALLKQYIRKETARMMRKNISFNVIGNRGDLPVDVNETLDEAIKQTSVNTGMTLTLALSYGGRKELVRAARSLARATAAGKLEPDAIDEACLAAALDTAGLPDPDLMIRTSGETRLSNFLLWQAAYAEFVFMDVLWPDFSAAEFCARRWSNLPVESAASA